MNAGSILTVLANQIGVTKQGFVIDRDRGIQVWNQPVFSYSFQCQPSTGGNSAACQTSLTYAKETAPRWAPHAPYTLTETYRHTVDLDPRGNVVGGQYSADQFDRPDFAWKLTISAFSDYFGPLDTLYKAAIQPHLLRAAGLLGDENDNEAVVDRAANLPVYVRPSQWKNAVTLTHKSREFGLLSYRKNERRAWIIIPAALETAGGSAAAAAAGKIKIVFKRFDTDRFFDYVRIYEGTQCEGALVRVLHGSQLPEPVVVNAPGACVTFIAHPLSAETGRGFEAEYHVLF